jgi:lipopolysaccharide transport system permease protein
MFTVIRSGAVRSFATQLNPVAMAANLWRHRHLIRQLSQREVALRYRATYLGILWSILTPLALLVVYTFVFAVVFRSRWTDDPNESNSEFALTMFCGMLLWNMFADVVTRAPTMIVHNPNYVKKVVFPLEVFVISGLCAALVNLALSYLVWLAGFLIIRSALPPITLLWLPLVLLPVCLVTCGVGWFLASVGVFIRDMGNAVVLVLQVLFFATPIFYSIERVPRPFRTVLEINPLSHSVEDARRVMIYGLPPDWAWWAPTLGGAALLALLGYAFFMKSKRAFADVL